MYEVQIPYGEWLRNVKGVLPGIAYHKDTKCMGAGLPDNLPPILVKYAYLADKEIKHIEESYGNNDYSLEKIHSDRLIAQDVIIREILGEEMKGCSQDDPKYVATGMAVAVMAAHIPEEVLDPWRNPKGKSKEEKELEKENPFIQDGEDMEPER